MVGEVEKGPRAGVVAGNETALNFYGLKQGMALTELNVWKLDQTVNIHVSNIS